MKIKKFLILSLVLAFASCVTENKSTTPSPTEDPICRIALVCDLTASARQDMDVGKIVQIASQVLDKRLPFESEISVFPVTEFVEEGRIWHFKFDILDDYKYADESYENDKDSLKNSMGDRIKIRYAIDTEEKRKRKKTSCIDHAILGAANYLNLNGVVKGTERRLIIISDLVEDCIKSELMGQKSLTFKTDTDLDIGKAVSDFKERHGMEYSLRASKVHIFSLARQSIGPSFSGLRDFWVTFLNSLGAAKENISFGPDLPDKFWQ